MEPPYLHTYENEAKYKYLDYKPSIFAKILKLQEKKKNHLYHEIAQSATKDEKIHDEKLIIFKNENEKWKNKQIIAQGIINKNPTLYKKILQELDPFNELEKFCSEIQVSVHDNKDLSVKMIISGDDIVPQEKYSLRESGTLLAKKMPKTELNLLYQKYVCSCMLRIAAEIFNVLPIERLFINSNCNSLNPATGYIEEQTVLLCLIPRKTIENINLSKIESVAVMKNFIHRMNFKKITGFEPIMPLSILEEEAEVN